MGVNLQPATRWEWERIVRRIRMPQERKLVALVLASYANAKGEQVRPGERRVAAVCGMGERTARRHIAALRDLGLLDLVGRGGGPNRSASLYRLTVPDDLLERAVLLDVDETSPASQEAGDCRQAPVDNPENSGQHWGRSSDENSGHLGHELRPLDDRTPATWVAAHHIDQAKDQNISSQVTTSPVADGGSEYERSSAALQRLPDLGAALIAAAPDGTLRERIIAAARLAQEAS